ncbi:JNK [Symbiodinium sp. CCMP2592]|nr:JNK [Symbiodinium sp. CCMP2592]
MSEHPGAPHDSVATITAAGHGGAAPAIDNGGWHTGPCAVRALVDEAIGSEASARIATDILAIAQGVTNTQADLDRLRNGVSDITEALESKIRDMWELLQAELRKERELFMQFQDSFRERRISDHETLEDHFAKLTSTINDRLIEFDERIHQFNEKRAGSLSMQLAETIRHIKQYPDALRQIQINISNAEARVAAVEQNATHRIEVIRSEMSRALYDHKESNRAHIDQLTARIQHLENAHVRRGGSDRSTPSRPERTQFFDISDHGGDIPRPADLPPVPGALFPGGPTTAIPRSSLLGPIDHGSPPGCNAAPAEKASTVHSQTSGINLDEILRKIAESGRSFRKCRRSDFRSSPTFPCQISYDTRTVPAGKGPSRWYDAMLGRSNLIGNGAGAPILHSETGTFTLAPNTSVTATLQHDAANDAMPPMPTFSARTSIPAPSAAPSGFGGPPPAYNGGGGYSGGDGPNDNGGAYGGGFGGHGHHGSGFGPGGGGGPPDGPPGGPPGGGGPPDGSGPPDGGLDPPSIRPSGRPSGNDTFQCERCTGTFPTIVRRSCISCRFSCCNGCCRDPLRICLVCLERQTGNPPGPNDSGFGGPKGDGSLSEAKKAKCKSFRLDPEPEPAQLRRWIVDMKERVANAFAYDPGYALSWVEIPDGTRYEDLLDECKYGMLENECNSAFRECVRSIALKNKIQTETERMHTINRRLGSRQILWLLYDFLRPHVTGDSTFKLVDLMKTTIDRFTHGSEQERLEAFSNRWDHVLAGISVDRPEDPVLCALFYEQVREFRCLELDMQLWDRDVSVRNYAYLRTVCVNAITTWRRRRNQEKMYTATRSTSAQRRYAELAEALVTQTILPATRIAKTIFPQSETSSSRADSPNAMTASSYGDFAFACVASFDMACPSVKRKTVSFGNTETRVIESSFPEPNFGPVNRERNLNYSWPEDIRGLNSARERRRAHMKAVLWREQVLLDDVDAKTLGDDACVLELTLSQRSACEVFAAAVKSIKRVRRLMLDSGVAHMRIDGLDELIEAYVLESTPSLLSLGKRCKELGYRFIWEPFCDPIFFDPKGRQLKIDVINNIPYLAPSETEVVAGRPDLPRVYPALPAPIIIHEKIVAAGEEPVGELDDIGELDLDMPGAKSAQKSAPDDIKKGRTNADTLRAFQQVFGDLQDVNSFSMDVERRYAPSAIREIYCDKAREFISTCKRVGISVKHSTPGMPRTNAIAESKVKLVLHGARVALRQAGLSAKFWPCACKHFCHARNIELREGQSAYSLRFNGAEFDGQVLPFGCLVDFYPTPARKQTRRSQKDEVVLGDGEEYAVPAPGSDGLVEVEVGFDDDGYLEWIDDGDDDRPGSLQGPDMDQGLSSYQRPSKFSPTSKPGVFLGYHFENGGRWDGDYIVADLEDFKRDALRASVHQVKKLYCSPKERWTFPMLAVYDKQTRSVCINDPAMHSTVPKPSERLDASDMLDLEDIDEIFALDESTRMTDDDIRQAREAELRAESSHGGGVDYWEYDPSVHKWTYHVVVPRKAMVHPSKTPGSVGESPDPWKLSTVRISHVQYKDKSPVTIYETGYAFGKTRLMQLWTGTVEFYDDGYAPPKKKLPPYHGSEILEGEGGLPYRQSVPRSERAYKGSRKPNSIDSESWRSMNRAEREGYVEAERREAESHAMSREDSRDVAPVDIAYDSEYESGAERHDKDYWYHDVAAGTITRFHVIERRARFNPTSVKDCPVDPATLTDVRMTMAMTDGTEFTLQDSWRSSDTRSLPCRWTGKTVFVIGSSAKTQIKVRTRMPNADDTGRRVQTANGYYGHALRAKGRTVVPAKSRACVVTDLEFEPPGGMSARLQPLRGSGLDVCPAMYTYNEGASQPGVDVLNPTDYDIIVEPGQDVAVVQFYTSVLAAVELDFTAEDVACDVSAPVEPSDDGNAVDTEPKKAFPELTFGDRDTSVAQGSVGPREIRMIKYDMRSFMEQCVSRYVELCGPKYKATLRSADTPFLDESRPEFDTNPDRPAVNRLLGHPADTPVPPGKGVLGKNKQPPKKAAAKTPAARSPQPKSPSLCREGLPSGAVAPTTERPPVPPIPTEQDDSNMGTDEAPVPIQTPRDESTGGGKRSEDIPIGLRMKMMMLKIGIQEIPQASIWQRLEQLTCNSGYDLKLHQLVDSFLLTTHPLADKQRKQYPQEFMDFIDRYRVMRALAFSRVATLSGDAAGVREKMDLTMALARHCMLFQAQSFKGSRDMLSNDTLQLMGTCYIPSPLASWNRNLMGYSSSTAEQRWFRTDTSIKHNDLTKLSPIELSREAVSQAEAVKFFKGFLQLRPTLSFIPGAFLALKALNRFPTLDSLKEQATHLDNDRKEHGYDLPAVDANGIGEAYPGRCVSIDDTLNWGASTPMTYEDGAGQTTIRPTDGWVYVPAMNSDIYDPQETFLHGTNLRYLWSILAHGGLFGEDYVTDDHGSHEPCVWVTGHASEAASSYASGTYLGGGYWFQVMICVSRTVVNTHGRTTKKLGGSQKQIRVGTRFLELCGIAFRPFRLLDDREQGVSTSPQYVIHGHRFLSADGTKAVAWHPWMEASPIDPRILKLLGESVARDSVEFADLTIQGGNTTQQVASTETEQSRATAADDQAAEGENEATDRVTVHPAVLRRNHWMPDSHGTSEHATVGGRYALLSELQSSSYRFELAPFFQLRAPIMGEEGSQGLPKPARLETIVGGPSKEWEAWCRHYRKAYGVMLGNFGYTPAKSLKNIPYSEEGTTDIVSAPIWGSADALVAVSIHGVRTVTTMASTIAFGGAPPTIKPAVPSKPQRFVVMHDGLLSFKSAKSWHDGEMNAHLKNALTNFGFPDSEVRVQAFDEDNKLKDMVDTLAMMQSETSIPPSNVHVLILWRGEDLWKIDQGWNKLTGDIDMARSQYAKTTARDALEKYNTIYGSVSLCGPVSPSMVYLPTLPGPLFEKYREEMRSIWDAIRRSNLLTLSFDAILEGLPYLKGYHIMHESKTIGVLCTRICSMFTLAALARFPSYGTRREYEIAAEKMWARTPVPEENSPGAVKAIVHSTVQDLIDGADRGADHQAAETVDMSQLGFDDDDDDDMPDDVGPTAPGNPIKQEQGTLADLPGVRHPDPIALPATPVPGEAMPVSPGLAPTAMNDEESGSSSDENDQQGDGDAAMPTVKKEESDEEFNGLLEGMTEEFAKMPAPRDAERTVAANRDAARPPAVPSIPLSTMKKPKPVGGEEAAGPTADNRQAYAHFESQVSEAEARREQAAAMKAHIAEVAKGAAGVENAEHLRSIADGLAKVLDPNMSDDNVFQGALYPPGDYALDAVTNRLAQGRRRVESNSNLIREMASDRFTPVLINRDTGETVSAIDARWTPEYGNRGELEAKVGAIISNLDAVVASMSTLPVFHPHIPSTYGMARSLLNTYQSLQIAIRHRGMGAMSFEQMVFKPEDLEVPTPDDWPDLIVDERGPQAATGLRHATTEFRKPEEDPVQSLMGLTDDLSYGTTGRSGDDRLSQFQRSMAVQLRNTAGFLASEFQKHARSIAASSSRRSDASGALSSQGDGAADNDLPSTEQVSVASERAIAPPPPNVAPPPPPTAAAPPRASEESAKEDDDDTIMDDDTAGQKPEQKPEEDADMGSGKELQDEVPGKAPPPAARTAESPPEHGLRSSPPNDMVAQGAALSGARGPEVDIDPASTTADQAANDPRNCRIEGPGIKATTIHRPDQLPERGIDSIAPIVQYEMTSVPIALPDFVVPGLDMGIDDSVHGRLVSATCLPPTDEQRKYSRRRFAMLSSNQTVYLGMALHKKPLKGEHDSFLRPESYEDCREIHEAVRAYNAKEATYRSIGGTSVSCSRLLIDDAQNIPAARIPDAGMISLVRKLLFRVLTQTKERPSSNAVGAQNRPQDKERGVPLYSFLDQSGIIAFDVIPMYMEREREYMKANAGEFSGRTLLQTSILDDDDKPSELTVQCITEIARTDNNRMFEFFYSTINDDGSPQFVGVRATYGFGPDNFNRFRLLIKCQHGPFTQLAQEHYVNGERRRNVARYHPQYGWGCATIREFFGYMNDCKLNPPKGQLFLTLLPYAPGSGKNNEWEEVYMNVRMNPKRETLSNTASSQSMLPEGMGSNRMIVFAIDLHMIAAGINPIAFHPRGYYAIKDSIPLACMPIAYFMDTGSLVFNTAFKYIGGPTFGTGPKRGDHRRETWPLASFDCPMCGASFPVGLHMCHSCTKPIHYPDGMFYADPVNPFQVEYYGSHAEWLNDLIERNKLTEFQLHEFPAIKQLRNFPVSRSLAEDHRQTAFFGVPPIKCTAADTSPKEVELFKRSVRGTIQGAIRLDISIERLVAAITGKEARCGVEDFFNSQSIACAATIVKHFGAVFATCREKPLCYYARWSIHCQRAYRVCLSRGYLSPYYTGVAVDYTVDQEMAEKIRLAHLPLQNANLAMRRHIRLSTEFGTLDEFRATITDTQKYQRYMRVDSESLSALLAKVTLTTCYGIPTKGEPGYISDDEAEEIEGAAAASEKPKGKGKGEDESNVQAINWRELDPLGRKLIPHHSDPRFTIIAEGNTALLDAAETPEETRKEFKEFVRDHSVKIKECFDDDRATEKTFFNLVEGVKDQLPDANSTDPLLMKRAEDVFEALPDELDDPPRVFDVAARQARRRDPAPQRRVQVTEQRQAPIPEAHAVPIPTDDEDEDDTELDRAVRPDPTSQRTGREHHGGVAPETTPPPPHNMPPPSNLPTRKSHRQTGYGAAHPDGEPLMVSGRAEYSDRMRLPSVLRMKTRVPESDLDNPTIEDIIRMYHAPNTLSIIRKKAAAVIIAMGANPDDDINMRAAGVTVPHTGNAGTGRAASPGSTSAATQERINPQFPAPSVRTASNPPSKLPRDEKWAPSIARPAPAQVIKSAEARGRTQQRAAEETNVAPPAPSDTASSEPRSRTMGPAKETTAKGKSRTGSNVTGLIDEADDTRQPTKGKGLPHSSDKDHVCNVACARWLSRFADKSDFAARQSHLIGLRRSGNTTKKD